MRTYSGAGAKELFTLLEQRKAEVEAVMRTVPGLVSYTLVRSAEDDGLCRDNPPVSQPGPRHTACGRCRFCKGLVRSLYRAARAYLWCRGLID